MKLRQARKIYRNCSWLGFCRCHRVMTTIRSMLRIEKSGEITMWTARAAARYMMCICVCVVVNAMNCFAGGETVPIESLDKPGALQAMQQAFDDKFSLRGGTITGTTNIVSSATVGGVFDAQRNATFSGTASTASFSGWLGIGITTATAQCNSAVTCTASCAAGYKAFGGGCNINASATNLTQQEPSDANWTGWHCQAAGGTPNITAYVICARIRFDP